MDIQHLNTRQRFSQSRIRRDFAFLARCRRVVIVMALAVVLIAVVALTSSLGNGLKGFWNQLWSSRSYSAASANLDQVFSRFQAMSCGIQSTEVALMSNNDGGLLHDVLFMDNIAGRVIGQYEVVVPFTAEQDFSYTLDKQNRQITVEVNKFLIAQPTIVGFQDEYHAEGLMSKLSSKEPVIDRVVQLGRQTIARNASRDYQNPSWFDDCARSIEAQWTLIARVFGYQATVHVHPPAQPLPIEWGPIKVSTAAEVLSS